MNAKNKMRPVHPGEILREEMGALELSASDVVRAGLRLLEEHEARVNALRDALIEGEASGQATPFDFDAFIAGKKTP